MANCFFTAKREKSKMNSWNFLILSLTFCTVLYSLPLIFIRQCTEQCLFYWLMKHIPMRLVLVPKTTNYSCWTVEKHFCSQQVTISMMVVAFGFGVWEPFFDRITLLLKWYPWKCYLETRCFQVTLVCIQETYHSGSFNFSSSSVFILSGVSFNHWI